MGSSSGFQSNAVSVVGLITAYLGHEDGNELLVLPVKLASSGVTTCETSWLLRRGRLIHMGGDITQISVCPAEESR